MDHFYCSNCGKYPGIAFGYCVFCTPQELLKLREDIKGTERSAGVEFDMQMLPLRRKAQIKSSKESVEQYRALWASLAPKDLKENPIL